MSVLACNREGCENIMCDRYSSDYGYICDECFEELVAVGLGKSIADFMDSEPNRGRVGIARTYFENIFQVEK